MKQIKHLGLIIASCCTIFSTQSLAIEENEATLSNFSYDYVEARIGISPVTYGAGFLMSVHPNAHLKAEIDTEFDSDFDSTLAAGFHAPINDWADVYGELGMRISKQRHFNNGDTEFGVELVIGARQWLGPQLEVNAELGHVSIAEDDHVFGSASVRFHATELFSIGGTVRINDAYDDQFLFTTRFKY